MDTKAPMPIPSNKKRLIVCCDGTWFNSDRGYDKPSIFNSVGKLQIPSNVTRIARSLRRQCQDGSIQIVEYVSGVGSAGTLSEVIGGGAFGLGISDTNDKNIRTAYSFLCANYVDGDEIILVGFSRGAFTARSVAGMIGDIGLLTRQGMEFFYPIFKDMENWRTQNYKDPFPGLPFDNKPQGDNAEEKYREMLLERGLTRVYENGGKGPLITVKAVGVWETVGSLGIPNISWLSQLGIRRGTTEFRFYDTNLSDRIENAFQALALDERRSPFAPTVWERTAANKNATSLKQVWFPGSHGNVGGGWPDTGIANMSLAWMMDQLASLGVEFDEATIPRAFHRLESFYHYTANHKTDGSSVEAPPVNTKDPEEVLARATAQGQAASVSPLFRFLKSLGPASPHWAIEPVYQANEPVRPWALGAIQEASDLFYKLMGPDQRSPNMYHRPDPSTGDPTKMFLEDTNEKMHSSVRVRLALKGLGLDDKAVWDAPSLKGRWRLRRIAETPIDSATSIGEDEPILGTSTQPSQLKQKQQQISGLGPNGKDTRWGWEYCGPEKEAPPERFIPEEPLGPYERQLLHLSGGALNVYEIAEHMDAQL